MRRPNHAHASRTYHAPTLRVCHVPLNKMMAASGDVRIGISPTEANDMVGDSKEDIHIGFVYFQVED